MKIEIGYPGQEVQIVDASANIERHFKEQGWPLPFIHILDTGEQIPHNTDIASKDPE
jgi:hypothetical protein